jgi:RNA polymerase sigma-70 factor (ECF subfamily)
MRVPSATGVIDERDLSALVDDTRAGRPAAFGQLVTRVQARVRTWAERFTGDPDAADDVAQEVLIHLERRVRQFRGGSRFSTWLFAVTRNVALGHRRVEQRRAALRAERWTADATTQHEDAHDRETLAALVLAHFDRLPPKQRRVFELVDLRGHDPAEVARALGMRPVTVRAHLFKARRAIRTRLLETHEHFVKEYLS